MRFLVALPIAMLVLVASPVSKPESPDAPKYIQLCELRMAPGNAFTFVPPPPRPSAQAPGGFVRKPASLTAATITVDYVGFGAAQEAEDAFQHAVDIWETLISSPVTIRVQATYSSLGPGVLGSAGAQYGYRNFTGAPVSNAFYGDPLADALGGSDLNPPTNYDILASFNDTGVNWYFGMDGNPGMGEYDFVTVVMHEIGHGLDFSGLAFEDGMGNGEIRVSGSPNVYDHFTEDVSGTPMLSYTDPSMALGAALLHDYDSMDPRGPGVYWGGPLGKVGNGYQTARLYTVDPWENGSSYSHLDEETYIEGDPNSLMTPSLMGAEAIHNPGNVTMGMFQDMGWNNVISNGTFSGGTYGAGVPDSWLVFNPPQIVYAVNSGVFEYQRDGASAVILQNTGEAVPADTPIYAQFSVGNTGAARKRIAVLMHDSDFSDLFVCTFYIPPGQAPTPYRMYSHTTKTWTNATLSLYAATNGTADGVYQLDNVSLNYALGGATTRTDCEDPNAPAAPGGMLGANLLTNGDFSGGVDGGGYPVGWTRFGTLTWQLAGNVFEFTRPTSTPPAGVLLQPTSTAMSLGEVVSASFDLGNSSGVRKRVTVLVHDLDFSDLSACTFWLDPGQALSTYKMRTFVSEGFGNATLSVYAATIGTEQWMRLDNAVMNTTPSQTPLGTECYEPGDAGPMLVAGDGASSALVAGGTSGGFSAALPRTGDSSLTQANASTTWQAIATTTAMHTLDWPLEVDLRGTSGATLSFDSWLTAARSRAAVQVSVDGIAWETIADIPASVGWTPLDVNLSPYAGQVIRVRFVFDGVSGDGAADRWLIRNVTIGAGAPAR